MIVNLVCQDTTAYPDAFTKDTLASEKIRPTNASRIHAKMAACVLTDVTATRVSVAKRTTALTARHLSATPTGLGTNAETASVAITLPVHTDANATLATLVRNAKPTSMSAV